MSIPKKERPQLTAPGSHYFDPAPAVESKPRKVHLHVGELALELQADRGVFGSRGVDLGTLVLLREAPPPPAQGDILDLGSGYGPIAIVLARRGAARRLTRRNAAGADVPNVPAATPDQVPPDVRFDAIYSNPPVRIGKAPLHELLLTWLQRLRPAGRAYLVVQRNLGADSLATWLKEEGYAVMRLKSKKGYRILEVAGPSS